MPQSELDPQRCASMINEARRIVALTGAGISTAAGIPDFRGPRGLYVTRSYDPETVFEISAFLRNPRPFYEFTRDFMGMLATLQPTRTHRFLAELEQQGRLHAVITQNIDVLHQQAGSRTVIPLHGGYWTSRCLGCGRSLSLNELKDALSENEVPRCSCGGLIKPDVVFFGEPVQGMDVAVEAAAGADLMLVLGSSLTVFPAALLPRYATCDVLVVNRGEVGLEPAPGRYFADADLDAFFTEVAPSVVALG